MTNTPDLPRTIHPAPSDAGTPAAARSEPATTPPSAAGDHAGQGRHTRLPLWACALLASVLMFADYIGTILLGVVLGHVVHNPSAAQNLAAKLLFSLVTLATCLLLLRVVGRRVSGLSLRSMGWMFTGRSVPMFLAGWAVVTLTLLVAQALPLALHLPVRPLSDPRMTEGTTGGLAVFAVVVGIGQSLPMQGMPEELIFRGWLLRSFADRPRLVLAVSCVVFGCLHYISGGGQRNVAEHLIYCLQAMGFAFLAGALAIRLRSLWAAIGVHGGMHLTNRILAYTSLPHEGPWVWLLSAVVMAAAALAVLSTWHGRRIEYDR